MKLSVQNHYSLKKLLGCFNPNVGQIWTNPNVGLKRLLKNVVESESLVTFF